MADEDAEEEGKVDIMQIGIVKERKEVEVISVCVCLEWSGVIYVI